jgi:hypothetical protein
MEVWIDPIDFKAVEHRNCERLGSENRDRA